MKSLMIIDDDPLLRKAITCIFEKTYRVACCASAEDAVPALADSVPDVVLLDLVLTGIDGLQFLHRLRKEHPNLPVIIISGAATNRDAVAALSAGAADFVRKPFDIDELRLRVERALALPQRQAQAHAAHDAPAMRLDDDSVPLREAVECFERERITRALAACDGVVSQAAERMGTTRRILQYRIQKLGIETSNGSRSG